MNDADRLCTLIFQMLMHMENQLDDQILNAQRLLYQMPTPDTATAYRDALFRREVWKDFANRVRSVLDFFRADGV